MRSISTKSPIILLSVALIVICSQCTSKAQRTDNKIITSILPLKYIVENITGKDFEISVLVPPGASPETYEVTPSQMMEISKSRVIFVTGLIDFERQLSDKLKAGGKSTDIIDLSQGLDLITGGDGCHGEQGTDPHIWCSPTNLKQMATTAYGKIALLYPDSLKYKVNYENFIIRLDSLDRELQTLTHQANRKFFIIYHPALTYYARDYGLKQIAIERDGKEPSAVAIKELVRNAINDGAKTILYQKQLNPAVVEAIASETGATCVQFDPLAEDVAGNLLEVTHIITEK